MIVVNYSEFRKNLKTVLDKTIMDHETVIVSRSNNNDVVLVSLQEYNSWMETMYLMRGEKNRERLQESIRRIDAGISEFHNLIEEA